MILGVNYLVNMILLRCSTTKCHGFLRNLISIQPSKARCLELDDAAVAAAGLPVPLASIQVNDHFRNLNWKYLPYVRSILWNKDYIRPMWNLPAKYGLIWHSTSTLGSWNSHWIIQEGHHAGGKASQQRPDSQEIVFSAWAACLKLGLSSLSKSVQKKDESFLQFHEALEGSYGCYLP